MARRLGPGQGTLAGLRWLVRVGPVPLEAWRVAMGWGRTATYSHASRLVASGWAASTPMARGDGSLIYATRTGVQVAGVPAAVLAVAPAPTTWAHCEACAWVASWLTARGREMTGPRELLASDRWRGDLEWIERGGVRRRGHRPDLIGGLAGSATGLPIEVELAVKSLTRLRAILALHASWIAAGKTSAVIYVCGSKTVAEHVHEQGAELRLSPERKNLRVESLASVRDAAVAARDAGDSRGTETREVA